MLDWLAKSIGSVFASRTRRTHPQTPATDTLLPQIVNQLPHFVFWKDRDSRYLGCNEAFARVANLSSPDQIVGLCDHDLPWGQAEADDYRADDAEVMRSGTPKLGIEEAITLADGTQRHLATSKVPLLSPAGEVIGVIGVFADITELREAKREVESFEEQLRLFVDQTPAAVAMFDTEMRYLRASRGWYEQYGLGSDSILGRSHYDVFPTIPERWKDIHKRVLGGETLSTDRDSFALADGSTIWVQWHLCPWRDSEGRIGGLIMHTEVITERVLHEQALERAREEADAANRAKTDFLANMSHEIRTPLTAILGYADLLGDNGNKELSAAWREQAGRSIRDNADHLLTVINDILDVTRLESGHLATELIATDPIVIVRQLQELVAPRVAEKGLKLRYEIGSALPSLVETDPTRLRQILLNAVGNAIKFTHEGEITITLAYTPSEHALHFEIRDTGIGLEADALERIRAFEAFTQADSSMSRRYGGSGLGLRISAGLAARLGGGLTIDSEPGVGTTVRVVVQARATTDSPMRSRDACEAALDEAHPQSEPPGPAIEERPLAGLQILLAEDGTDNQRLITHYLRRAGADVTVCENGQVALDTLERMQRYPDLVLMDMQMPVLDGYAATARLRADGFVQPIVAITAHAMVGDRERCLAAGCNDYVTKPIRGEQLIEICQAWTRQAERVRNVLH